MQQVGIGIIGCGNISGAYLKALQHFPIMKVCGIADLNAEISRRRGPSNSVWRRGRSTSFTPTRKCRSSST